MFEKPLMLMVNHLKVRTKNAEPIFLNVLGFRSG